MSMLTILCGRNLRNSMAHIVARTFSALNATKFFKACRAPRGICYVDLKGNRSDPEPKEAGILQVKVTSTTCSEAEKEITGATGKHKACMDVKSILSEDSGVTAFILNDDGACWPTFAADKQSSTTDSDVFVQRTAEPDKQRFE